MNKIARRALPMLLALSLTAPLAAQDQPRNPTPVARFSIASMDALTKLATDLGIPGAEDLRKHFESAPFLAPDSLDTTKPLGFIVVAADPQKLLPNIEGSIVLGLPLQSGKVTLEDLTKAGAKPVEGEPNTVTHQEFIARRATNYLFVKPPVNGTFGLSAMTENIFAPEYRQPGTVAAVSLDFATFRKVAPEAYKDLANNVVNLPMMFLMGAGAMGAPANPEAGKPVLAVLDKMDRFTLTLGQDAQTLHLRSWLMPTPISTKAKSAPRPAFPAGTIVQMHVVFPDAATAGAVEQQVANLPEDDFGELPPVLRGRAKELAVRAAHLVSQSDALSVGFTMKDSHPLFYMVGQLSADLDGSKEVNDIATQAAALATEGGMKVNAESSTYDAGGKKVQRTILAPEANATDKLVIDTVQSDKILYLTFSDNADGKYVGDLASAGMSGTSNIFCAGAIDLGAALSATGGMGLPGLTPDKMEALKKTFAGQGITWTVQSSEQNFLFVDLAVPMDVVKEFVKSVSGQ